MSKSQDPEAAAREGEREQRLTGLLHAYGQWSRLPVGRSSDEAARRVMAALTAGPESRLRPGARGPRTWAPFDLGRSGLIVAAAAALLVLSFAWLVLHGRNPPGAAESSAVLVADRPDSNPTGGRVGTPGARDGELAEETERRVIVHTLRSGTRLLVALPDRRPGGT